VKRTQAEGATPLPPSQQLVSALLKQLPFTLTGAQQRVLGDIQTDLASNKPMLRLVQGDVGSGKTLVAVLAALQAIEAGHQAAMMAPTELLAEQHFRTLSAWLEPLGLSCGLLTGKLGKRQRGEVLDDLASGRVHLAVGTHALFQEAVQYQRLGLVIIDEQHRFGVHQRLALKEKAVHGLPHQLTMTATPIPRTLAMTAYADLDVSIIDELPPGRTPVTIIENPERLGLAQLHQLRGRVGRGTVDSHCLLLFGSPLSAQGQQRLEVMRSTSDGFHIAEEDLKLRGPGEVLGTRQTGALEFRVADLERDRHWLDVIPELAKRLTAEYPSHVEPLVQRWLWGADRYAQV